ncbi:putative integral membrane protein [Candida albicans]|uniref:Putative integral membrane protein n=1 Tax=Candida albicans TaxID=5476 RepID=A0A8H6BWY5_CANAX|nr:putative integral membrane protein [Candida albicans]
MSCSSLHRTTITIIMMQTIFTTTITTITTKAIMPTSHRLRVCVISWLLVVYLMLGSNFMGGKFLINFLLPQSHKLAFTNVKHSLVTFIKMGAIDVFLFYGLGKVVKKKSYFNYLVILSKAIVASEFIGSSSINYINSISSKKFTTKIQYDDKNRIFNSNLINAIVCFIIINYVKQSPIAQSSIPTDDISVNVDNNQLLDIYTKNLPKFNGNYNSNYSVALKNFENFIISPFNSKLSVMKNRMRASSLSNLAMKTTTTSTTTSLTSSTTSTSLTTTTISPNVTLIENTIIVQPFWSIIAAVKAILKNPNLFNGESTKKKNEGGVFLTKEVQPNVPMAIMVIDSSKVVLHVLSSIREDIEVRLNNIKWSYFKVVGEYLVIYGLTPLFQYEVDIVAKSSVLNHLVINTTDDDNQVINKSSKETSSLATLQTSLESVMNKTESLKAKLKKYKKDENKKITEMRNSIELLKNKISKNRQGNDNRIFGKIKGLKHSVMQLENEIEGLNKEISELSKTEGKLQEAMKSKESAQLQEIAELNKIYADFESRMKDARAELKTASQELTSLSAKSQKLMVKQAAKQEELRNLSTDIKNIKKNEISAKFTKRLKRTNEKFETILPKIIQETESLTREYNELVA